MFEKLLKLFILIILGVVVCTYLSLFIAAFLELLGLIGN